MTREDVHQIDYALIERLHREGRSASQIAEQVGCTSRTVYRWRSRNGFAVPRSPIMANPATLERARELFDDGASQSDVQRSTGMGRRTLRRHFPGRGWSPEESGRHAVVAKAFLHLGETLP